MADEFNPDAIDGDGDGLLQDGTEFERPVELVVEEPIVVEEVLEAAPVEAEAPEAPVVEEDTSFVISSNDAKAEPKSKKKPAKPALAPVADGVIGSGSSASAEAPKPQKAKKVLDGDAVALFSTRNVRWEGVGSIFRGYNIVSSIDAEKWLERAHVRTATPEEIAREFKS